MPDEVYNLGSAYKVIYILKLVHELIDDLKKRKGEDEDSRSPRR